MLNDEKYTVSRDNIYYLCYIFEKLSRETLNSKNYLITKFNREDLEHICKAEHAYHTLSSEQVVAEFIEEFNIEYGKWNRITEGPYRVPYESQMARTYTRIITKMNSSSNLLDNFIKAMKSPMADAIDDYHSPLFFHNSDYLAACFDEGTLIDIWERFGNQE